MTIKLTINVKSSNYNGCLHRFQHVRALVHIYKYSHKNECL